jgi:tight adherence protein B
MILFLAFTFMVLLVFCIVVITMRSTPEQKAVTKRLATIRASTGGLLANSEESQLLKEEATGGFVWIEELLERFSLTHRLRTLLLQANSKTTLGTLVAISFGAGWLGALLLFVFMPVPLVALLGGIGMAYAPFAVMSIRKARRVAAFAKELPTAIDMIARSLRAGHSMVAAISIVAEHASEPVATEFGEVFRQQNFGLPIRDALMQLLDRVPSQDLRVVVTGILVQKDTGGNLAEILDRTVHVIRERLRIHGEIRTHTAQGRMTGWILCSLPIVMLVLINMINPGYSDVLLKTEFGHKMLYVGIALLSVGAFMIRQIVNGIEV